MDRLSDPQVFGDFTDDDAYDVEPGDFDAIKRIYFRLRLVHTEDLALGLLLARLRREGVLG